MKIAIRYARGTGKDGAGKFVLGISLSDRNEFKIREITSSSFGYNKYLRRSAKY